MPDWLVILLLMGLVIVMIQPEAAHYDWYQGLRRPLWLSFSIWLPAIRLVLQVAFYVSLLILHSRAPGGIWVAGYLLPLALLQASTWCSCRLRRLGLGCLVALLAWLSALVLAILVWPISALAAWLVLPFLLWIPVEGLSECQMLRLNGIGVPREPRRRPRPLVVPRRRRPRRHSR